VASEAAVAQALAAKQWSVASGIPGKLALTSRCARAPAWRVILSPGRGDCVAPQRTRRAMDVVGQVAGTGGIGRI
jgi:hypothetical protein